MAVRRISTRGQITWGLVGDLGAVTLSGLLLPGVLESPAVGEASELLGFIPTDAGWLMPADLGLHRPEEDPRGGLQWMEECHWLPEGCWYGGSGLAAWEPFQWWQESGFDERVLEDVLRAHYAASFGEQWV